MELEFEREAVRSCQVAAQDALCQEESLEAIVPDACPDILQIVTVCGQAYLTNQQVREGGGTFSGTVRTVVLYRPEGGGGLRRMEVAVPLTMEVTAPGLTERGELQGNLRLRSAQARALNPRKVQVRVEVVLDWVALQPREQILCQGVLEEEGQGIQQLTREGESYLLCAVEKKPFPLTEEVRFGGGESGTQLVWCRGVAQCGESKRIGNKLIFKGAAEIQLLLQQPDGTLAVHRESLPFSQVMELPSLGEGGDCRVSIGVCQLSCQPVGEDGRTYEVSLDLLAQAQVWCRRPLTLLQDLYSTGFESQVEREEQVLCQLLDCTPRTVAMRELMEGEELLRGVVDSWVQLGPVTQRREGSQLVLESEAQVEVLCLDQEGQLGSLQGLFPIRWTVEAPPGVQCLMSLSLPGEVYAVPAAGGLEVRFQVELLPLVLGEQRVPVVCGATLGEARSRGEGEQPSVVLRLATPGEGLWDLAKAYGTTTQEIVQANQLEEGALPTGQMLLIPSVR